MWNVTLARWLAPTGPGKLPVEVMAMSIAYDLDGWASVIIPHPPTLSLSLSSSSDHMPFYSLRAAVKFVMDEMNENERSVCTIITDSGPLDAAQIEELYRIVALEND